MSVISALDAWEQAGWIRPLERELADFVARVVAEAGAPRDELVELLAALLSHQIGRGHVCLDLADLLQDANRVLALPPERATMPSQEPIPVPVELLGRLELADCLQRLSASPAVSMPPLGDHQPGMLVLEGSRLYFYRLWLCEQTIARGIQSRLDVVPAFRQANSPESQTLAQALVALFDPATADPGLQKMACAVVARRSFGVVTGGPGTGKTTTVVRLLAALQAVALSCRGRPWRIRLAAPTGKAASRLNESIARAIGTLPLSALPGQPGVEHIPSQVSTIHRLLGSRPGTRRFRHDADHPMVLDILVIDEASMVDVELMASVMNALPSGAQLILLGDKDQLASVEAGAVLGEICGRAQQGFYLPDQATWLHEVTGTAVPDQLVNAEGTALDQAIAMLRFSYRFQGESGIHQLAEATRGGVLASDWVHQCRSGRYPDVAIIVPESTAGGGLPERQKCLADHALEGGSDAFGGEAEPPRAPRPAGYRFYLDTLKRERPVSGSAEPFWADWAKRVLAAFGEFQILCALRDGPWGVEGVNRLIEEALGARGLVDHRAFWYEGRPVMAVRNDYQLGIMNGDIGVALTVVDPEGVSALRVAFGDSQSPDGVRWLSPSRLSGVETVYAMTVHKSQGSEFTHTCLVLPDRMSPVLNRELIYTGVTRARQWFSLVCEKPALLHEAVAQRAIRATGLRHALERLSGE